MHRDVKERARNLIRELGLIDRAARARHGLRPKARALYQFDPGRRLRDGLYTKQSVATFVRVTA
jgi:hypothetical protein